MRMGLQEAHDLLRWDPHLESFFKLVFRELPIKHIREFDLCLNEQFENLFVKLVISVSEDPKVSLNDDKFVSKIILLLLVSLIFNVLATSHLRK